MRWSAVSDVARPGGQGPPTFAVVGALLLVASVAVAESTDPLGELQAELAALREAYEARLSQLERRIEELEAERREAEPNELTRLREAARAAAEEGAPPEPAPPATTGAAGGRLNLNRLNPELSATGNLLAVTSNRGREELEIQELEVDLQAALDPFSRTRLTLALEGEEIDIEEAYVTYASLPGGLSLTAGKIRQQLGVLNRQHLHALPQSDYPLVIRTFFDEEGLGQTGFSLRWLVPKPWASANEVTLEVTDGSNTAFGGEDFERLVTLGHLKSFWELTDAAYLEWGLTAAGGGTAAGGASRVWGSDLTWHWQPPGRAKYREVTWRTELFRSERDAPDGVTRRAWGGYSYLEGLVARNLYVGLRADRVEDPLEPELEIWGVRPYLTWWQSEWVRLRAELQHLESDLAEDETRFVFQLTWAAGPHKHETY